MSIGLAEALVLGLACMLLLGLPLAIVLVLVVNRRKNDRPENR